VCTGEGEGMIEVVCNAETAAKIQMVSSANHPEESKFDFIIRTLRVITRD